jgi:uncharacterized protein
MATPSPFRIPVADLLRRSGSSRALQLEAPIAGLAGPGAEISADQPIVLDLSLERVSEGIVVRGTVRAHWNASCSRCLAPVGGEIAVHVDELFELHPLAGETYALEIDIIDLEPMIRDALLLEVPAKPLCRDDCAGLCPSCGIDRNSAACECGTTELDPRWAALRSLDL